MYVLKDIQFYIRTCANGRLRRLTLQEENKNKNDEQDETLGSHGKRLKEKKARIETLEQNVTALEKLKIEERLIKLETKVAGIIRNASVAAYCDFGVNLDDDFYILTKKTGIRLNVDVRTMAIAALPFAGPPAAFLFDMATMFLIKFLEKRCRDAELNGRHWDFDFTDIINVIRPDDLQRIYKYIEESLKKRAEVKRRQSKNAEKVVNTFAPLVKDLIKELPKIIGFEALNIIAKQVLGLKKGLEKLGKDSLEVVETGLKKGPIEAAKKAIDKTTDALGNIISG
uniref:Uncharacterized protein n=2 Tax=Meloidogyne TaxID=189290 RepID=A0A914LJE7_MELIC